MHLPDPDPSTALIESALVLHQQGRLDDAARLYQEVLANSPWHFDALHLSGLIAKQRGDPQQAVKLISLAFQHLDGAPTARHATAFCNLGACLQQCGAPAQAEQAYRAALAAMPAYPIAWSNLGNVLKSLGRHSEAGEAYRQSLELNPDSPETRYNLGLLQHDTGQLDAALEQFDHALRCRPGYADALFARGTAHLAKQWFQAALRDFGQVLQQHPTHAGALCNRAICLRRMGQEELAMQEFEATLQSHPAHLTALLGLAHGLGRLGRDAEAITAYQRAAACGAEPELIRFALAALGAAAIPDAAPATYVRSLFDQYADHFDAHLTGTLEYDLPEHIGRLLEQYLPQRGLLTLDLGCGTGLCASILRSRSAHLTGLDLSEAMLRQAEQRGLYDTLICADLRDFLDQEQPGFDLMVASDVLVYIGNLGALFAQIANRLNPGGWLCCSVESNANLPAGTDYTLQSSSRYQHSERYLRRLAGANGLHVMTLDHLTTRREGTGRVGAILLLLQKIAF